MKNFYLYLILILVAGFTGFNSPELERFICIAILGLCLVHSFVQPLADIAETLKSLEKLARGGK